MWLLGVNARIATEVRFLLTVPEPAMGTVDRYTALGRLLQLLAQDIAGRNVTNEECEQVWVGGLPAFERLLRQLGHEQFKAHVNNEREE